MHKGYRLALKVEEKRKKKQEKSNRGRGRGRDGRGQRGSFGGRSVDQISQGESELVEKSGDSNSKSSYRGRGSSNSSRGRSSGSGRGSYFATMKCYNCHQLGHPAYRYAEKSSSSQGGERRVNYTQEDATNMKTLEVSLDSEVGENLMIRRVWIKVLALCEPI